MRKMQNQEGKKVIKAKGHCNACYTATCRENAKKKKLEESDDDPPSNDGTTVQEMAVLLLRKEEEIRSLKEKLPSELVRVVERLVVT